MSAVEEKKRLIAIDGGTSTTRVCLVEEGHCIARFQVPVGVRDTAASGSNQKLQEAVRQGISQVLESSGLSLEQVRGVYAGGMITSDVGLAEVPHLPAPVGLHELAAGVQALELPQVCSVPIHFVPGVKNNVSRVDWTTFAQMDMMRGEELEAVALLSLLPLGQEYLLVLPGSHTKFVMVDPAGKITGSLTTLSGELLAVLTRNTVLADSVHSKFVQKETYCRERVLAGCREAAESGLGRAAFAGRILTQFQVTDAVGAANYLLGAALWEDVRVLAALRKNLNLACQVVVAGKFAFRQALADLFQEFGPFTHVQAFPVPEEFSLSAKGAWLVAEAAGTLR